MKGGLFLRFGVEGNRWDSGTVIQRGSGVVGASVANRIREDHAQYRTKKGNLFDHEDLDVYQVALQLVAWLEPMLMEFSCSADLRSKLDKSTTAIVLNIAEGNRHPYSDTLNRPTSIGHVAATIPLAGNTQLPTDSAEEP